MLIASRSSHTARSPTEKSPEQSSTLASPGKVIIAGAGPGDPDLISVKAAKALQQADIILSDKLVSRDILENYVSPKAKVIFVGRAAKKGIATHQKSINGLMIRYARAGKKVVRLKGGDVSVFSNILDELQTLIEQNIRYELIPGISAALGAAAYTGIPLTARNYAAAVRFLTYNKVEPGNEHYWRDLAQTDDTLVFYMSAENIDTVVEQLKKNQITSDKYIAVVEQATTSNQFVSVAPIHQHKAHFNAISFSSPTLIIIGKVVALYEQFAWLRNSQTHESYFKENATETETEAAFG